MAGPLTVAISFALVDQVIALRNTSGGTEFGISADRAGPWNVRAVAVRNRQL